MEQQNQESRRVEPANPNPCSACPWRTSNHGKVHPDGWYTAGNRNRLWKALRNGERMTCHITDPTNPLPIDTPRICNGVPTHECTGGLMLQQREFMIFQQAVNNPHYYYDAVGSDGNALRRYRKLRPHGMTRVGLVSMVNRVIFDGGDMPMLALGAPVSHPALDRPSGQTWLECMKIMESETDKAPATGLVGRCATCAKYAANVGSCEEDRNMRVAAIDGESVGLIIRHAPAPEDTCQYYEGSQ